MKFIKNNWTILFIFLTWFIFSSPYFIFGRVPYASTYQVNFFPPWSIYDKFHGPVKNNAMPDVATQIYPWKKFTINTYKIGQLPLWNPYNFSGNPHLANDQSAVLSPFNLLFFVFPFLDAWSLLILLQPLLAGLFMYLMLRSFGLKKVSSLAGSISFMFCGFLTVWMAYGTLAYAILFLPLSIFSIQKYLNSRKNIYILILSLTVPLSFFAGHFQTSFYFLLALSVFLIFKILNGQKMFLPIIAVIFGLVISLLQIVPSLEFYDNSVRSSSFLKSDTIAFQYLATIFSPDYFGNPVTRNDWFGHYAEWSSFVGIIPFALVFFAFLKRKKEVVFFLLFAVFSLALALDSPLALFIVSLKLPVISTSSLSRIIVLFSFSLSVLCAYGLDNLIAFEKNIKKISKFFVPLLFTLVFLIVLPFFLIPHDKFLITIKSLRLPIFIFSLGISGYFVSLKLKKFSFYPVFLVLLLTIQSLYFAYKWMPFDPKSLVFPDLPVINAIKENIGYGRLFGNFGAEISSYYGIGSIEGYDPLYIQRYGEFIQSADFGKLQNAMRSVVKISRRGDYMNRAIDLLGVNLIFHPIADTNQNWAFPVWEDPKRFTKIFQDNKIQIYRNKTAMNRVSLFYNYQVIKDKEKEIEKFYNPSFDFRNTLLLEESPKINLKKGTGTADIVSYSPDVIKIIVKASSPALLLLSDNFYPGWKAYVNGKETRILRADYTFRSVIVPSGKSKVLFKFEPIL